MHAEQNTCRLTRLASTLVSSLVVLAGCASAPETSPSVATRSQDGAGFLAVDCLLPPQVRKLGRTFTYLAPRRPIKTTAMDCEIRGGEYVAYDRASYSTALKIWLPKAQDGEPAAQTYVGEIYEKGLGVAPDYGLAVHWYRKAAAQGHSRAQINLGYMYESGLGVPRDLPAAMNWYRKASGLSDGELEFVSSVEAAQREAARQEAVHLRAEVSQLRGELEETRRMIDMRREQLNRSKIEVQTLKKRLEEKKHARSVELASFATGSESSASALTDEARVALEGQLEEARRERELLLAQIEDQQRSSELLSSDLEATRGQLQERKTELESSRAELNATLTQLQGLNRSRSDEGHVEHLRRQLEERQALAEGQREEIHSLKMSVEEKQRRLREFERQEQLVEALTQDLKEARAQLQQGRMDLEELRAELAETATKLADRTESAETKAQARESAIELLKSKLQGQRALAQEQRDQTTRLENQVREQQWLIEELQAKRVDVNALRRELDRAEADLGDRRGELSSLRSQLEATQAELERVRRAADQAEGTQALQAERLSAELAQQQAVAAQQREQIFQLEASVEVKQRVISELEREREEIETLRRDLEAEKAALKQRQQEVESLENELAAVSSELDEVRLVAASSEEQKSRAVEALSRKLADQRAMVNSQEADLAWLESEMQTQLADMRNQLDEAQRKENRLQLALSTRTGQVASLQNQLAATEATLSATSLESGAEIEQLEEQLRQREDEIARREQEIAELENELSEARSQVTASQGAASVIATVPVGPTIEVIDPPLSVTRGFLALQLLSPLQEVEIIGKVTSQNSLLSFRVNDRQERVDDNGLFRVPVQVGRSEKTVRLVAVDQQGLHSSLDFSLVPADQALAGGLDSPPLPKSEVSASPPLNFGSYHALIIGNNRYQHLPNLATARNDAQAVSTMLREKYGFDSHLLVDADRYTILSALNRLRETLTENDNLLVYYAGHGELDRTNLRGYWLPIDAESQNSANWISNVAITDILNVMSAKHILVVADSCYSGSMTRTSLARLQPGMSGEARNKWLKTMAKTRTRVVMTSGGLKPVLDAGGGKHSIFARAFLAVLEENEGVLEGFRLYSEVQKRVKTNASAMGAEQDPRYAPLRHAGHEAGEFLLLPDSFALHEFVQPALLAEVRPGAFVYGDNQAIRGASLR